MTKEEAIEILYKMNSMTWRSGERGFEAVEMAASALRKEQYKPSKEQMNALLWVIENARKGEDVNIQLNLLYEDLTKLMQYE